MPWILLRPRLLSLGKLFRRNTSDRKKVSQLAAFSLVLSIISACSFISVSILLTGLSEDQAVKHEIVDKLIDLSSFALLALIFFSSLISAIGNFYGSENNFLFYTVPVSSTRLFIAKFAETFIETTFMLYIFLLPALFALGLSFHLTLSTVLTILLLGQIFLIIPCSLGITIATLAVQIIHRIWSHGKLLIVVGSIVSIFFTGRISNVLISQRIANKQSNLLQGVENPNFSWLPSHWISECIKDLVWQRPLNIEQISLIGVTAMICALLALTAYHFLRHFAREATMTQQHSADVKSGNFRNQSYLAVTNITSLLKTGQQNKAIAVKDIVSLLRDKAQAVQLLLLFGASGVYLSIFQSFSNLLALQNTALSLWAATLATLNVFFTGVLLTTIMTRLVYPSISLEGKSFSLLQSAPISLDNLMKIKTRTWLPLVFFLSSIITILGLTAISAPPLAYLWGVIIASLISLTLTKVAVSIGALFAKFDWESVNQIHVGLGTMNLFAVSLFYSIVFSLAAAPVFFLIIVPEISALFGNATIVAILIFSIALLAFLLAVTKWITAKGENHLAKVSMQ